MKKSELIAAVARRTGALDMEDARNHVNAMLEVMAETLMRGEEMVLPEFGRFEAIEMKARRGRNLTTGKAINIAPSKAVRYRPARRIREAVATA